jgi:hypothetical protein
VDAIDELNELLLVGEPFLQHENRFLNRHQRGQFIKHAPLD